MHDPTDPRNGRPPNLMLGIALTIAVAVAMLGTVIMIVVWAR